jgi:hypothetical protein
MNSEKPIHFAVYNLRDLPKEPRDIHDCPECESLLLKFSIPPSPPIVDDLLHHSGVSHGYSHLDRCPSCGWWAIRESWFDLGPNETYDFLIVGDYTQKLVPEAIDQPQSLWRRVLENQVIYPRFTSPLPVFLRQKIAGSPERPTGIFTVNDQVRLLSDRRVRRPIGSVSPLCRRGSQGTVVRSAAYLVPYKKELETWRPSENMIDETIKLAMLNEAAGALESGVCCAVQLERLGSSALNESGKEELCKVGKIYLLGSESLERIQ